MAVPSTTSASVATSANPPRNVASLRIRPSAASPFASNKLVAPSSAPAVTAMTAIARGLTRSGTRAGEMPRLIRARGSRDQEEHGGGGGAEEGDADDPVGVDDRPGEPRGDDREGGQGRAIARHHAGR